MDVDLDAFRERVLIDKGAHDGVFVGQAVLDAGGVFGQVARVEQLTSEVILVSDAAHAIPVQINRNGLRTIAVGTGDTSSAQATLSAHQRRCGRRAICWSLRGSGGGFPAGYPVGTVAEVKRDPAQSLADVDVRPAAPSTARANSCSIWLKPSGVLPAHAARACTGDSAAPAALTGRAHAAPTPATAAPTHPATRRGQARAAATAAAPAGEANDE